MLNRPSPRSSLVLATDAEIIRAAQTDKRWETQAAAALARRRAIKQTYRSNIPWQ